MSKKLPQRGVYWDSAKAMFRWHINFEWEVRADLINIGMMTEDRGVEGEQAHI